MNGLIEYTALQLEIYHYHQLLSYIRKNHFSLFFLREEIENAYNEIGSFEVNHTTLKLCKQLVLHLKLIAPEIFDLYYAEEYLMLLREPEFVGLRYELHPPNSDDSYFSRHKRVTHLLIACTKYF